MKSTRIVCALLFGALLATTANAAQADKDKNKKKDKSITLTEIGRYAAGPSTVIPGVPLLPRAEIAAYDPATKPALRDQRGSDPYRCPGH